VSLRGSLLEAELELDGSIEVPLELGGVDVAFAASLPELSQLGRETHHALPRLGPLEITGRLTNSEGPFALEDLSITSPAAAPVRLEVTGSVRDVALLRGVDLDVRLDAPDSAFLQPLVDFRLPDVGALSGSVDVEDADGSLGVEGELHADKSEQLELDLTGGYDDLSRVDEINVKTRLWARDLRVVGEALGVEPELPPLGPLEASARSWRSRA
jgi:hypothetical protein